MEKLDFLNNKFTRINNFGKDFANLKTCIDDLASCVTSGRGH